MPSGEDVLKWLSGVLANEYVFALLVLTFCPPSSLIPGIIRKIAKGHRAVDHASTMNVVMTGLYIALFPIFFVVYFIIHYLLP